MTILVDTSVWIDHFRKGSRLLERLLHDSEVLTHPFIIGELACGNLKNRSAILENLGELSSAPVASHEDILRMIEGRRLWGRGIGWMDAHLLASALLANSGLWTLDQRLGQVADDLEIKPLVNETKPS